MSKETAFHPRLQAMTDQWMDLFGYWAPSVVTDTLEEYRACRETAALMDFTMLRKVDIEGPGALAFVNGIVTRDVSKLGPGQIGYGALCDEHGKMIDDCTVMVRSADDIRFCGANDRDFHLFRELAPAGHHRERDHRRDAAPLPAGAAQPRDAAGAREPGSLECRVPVLHVPRGRRDRRDPGLHDEARVHGGARLRALGRARAGAPAVGRAPPRAAAAGDEGDRHGRARPVPDRGRLHHRRRRVRPDGVAVRVRARLVGRPREGRLPGARGDRPRSGCHDVATRQRRARRRRRCGERRAAPRRRHRGRPRHAGGRVAVPRRQDARPREAAAGAEGAGDEGRRARRRRGSSGRGRRAPGLREGAPPGEGARP